MRKWPLADTTTPAPQSHRCDPWFGCLGSSSLQGAISNFTMVVETLFALQPGHHSADTCATSNTSAQGPIMPRGTRLEASIKMGTEARAGQCDEAALFAVHQKRPLADVHTWVAELLSRCFVGSQSPAKRATKAPHTQRSSSATPLTTLRRARSPSLSPRAPTACHGPPELGRCRPLKVGLPWQRRRPCSPARSPSPASHRSGAWP